MSKRQWSKADIILTTTMFLVPICYWTVIIAGVFGDTNYFAPIGTIVYMLSTSIVIYQVADEGAKHYYLRTLLYVIILWAALIVPYLIILAIKGIL